MRCLDPYSRRGVVLVAALVLLTFLAVVVTGQMERLQFVSNESRTAARIAQRELDVNSALVFAEGVLRADAAENDYDAFGDLWTRPCSLQVGETELLVRIGDHVFRGAVDDRWFRHEQGIPDGVSLLDSQDPYVHRLFSRASTNLNTAPMQLLGRGLSRETLDWIKGERQQRGFARQEDLRDAPGYDEARLGTALSGVTFTSPLFLVEARVCWPMAEERWCYWVLHREDGKVTVIYSGYGNTMK